MKKIIFLICCIWSLLISASFIWNYTHAKEDQETMALQVARNFFGQIVLDRSWNAGHGGVYVPVTDKTQPNPYLKGPLRDIKVNEDLTLTKVNPAFMTRQISQIATDRNGVQFHITSLNPLRPENRASGREESALQAFEQGKREVGEVISGETSDAFFYMAPLLTQKVCLQCHACQGYQKGDIRGGISVTLPFTPHVPLTWMIFGHLAIGLLGVFGIAVFGKKLNDAYEEIKRQAAIDALTGIPNRRRFSERILAECKRSYRAQSPVSIIMCDVDNFKSYNDTYGHEEGDECLRKIAQSIQKSMRRPGDFCARYGGEEFVAILSDTPENGALVVAEQIRKNVLQLDIKHEKSAPLSRVSISLGVATSVSDRSMSCQELVKHADTALYRAKENGRNRVGIFDHSKVIEEQSSVASIDRRSVQPVRGPISLAAKHAGIVKSV